MTARVIDLAQWRREREEPLRPVKRKRPRGDLIGVLVRGPEKPPKRR
jgi:hypothetical protein